MDVEETRRWHVSTSHAGGLAKQCEGEIETHDMRLIRVICHRAGCRRLWGRRISCVSTATRCLSIGIHPVGVWRRAGGLAKQCEGDVETHNMRLIRVLCRRMDCRRLWGRRILCVSTATRCHRFWGRAGAETVFVVQAAVKTFNGGRGCGVNFATVKLPAQGEDNGIRRTKPHRQWQQRQNH